MDTADRDAYEDWISLDDYIYIPFETTLVEKYRGDIEAFERELQKMNRQVRDMQVNAIYFEKESLGDLRRSLVIATRRAQLPFKRTKVIVSAVRKGSVVIEGAIIIGLGKVLKEVVGKPTANAWASSQTRKRLVKGIKSAIDHVGKMLGITALKPKKGAIKKSRVVRKNGRPVSTRKAKKSGPKKKMAA
jgi:hypothetical protein